MASLMECRMVGFLVSCVGWCYDLLPDSRRFPDWCAYNVVFRVLFSSHAVNNASFI